MTTGATDEGTNLAKSGFQVVAINDLCDTGTMAHLLEYDSTFGRLGVELGHDDDVLSVGWHSIPTFSECRPDLLPWADLGVDPVIECRLDLDMASGTSAMIRPAAR